MGDEAAGAEAGSVPEAAEPEASEAEAADDWASDAAVVTLTDTREHRGSGFSPLRKALIAGLAIVVAIGGLCGWLGYRAHKAHETEQFRALLVKVGRQGAINLTTVDYEHADADVQRILDSATGEFYDDFKNRSGPFVEVLKQVQSKSDGTVTEAGLESATDQEGQVLVAVTVRSSNKGTADAQPRYWRMRLTVSQQAEGVKVSKVEFVP